MPANKYLDHNNVLRLQRHDLTSPLDRARFLTHAGPILLARLDLTEAAGTEELETFTTDIRPPRGVRRSKGVLAFSDVPDEPRAFAGFATMHEFRERSHATPRLSLGFLAVHPEHASSGIDGALVIGIMDPYDGDTVILDANEILPDFVNGRTDSADGEPTRRALPPSNNPAADYPETMTAKSVRRLAYRVVPHLGDMNIGQGFAHPA